MRLHLKLEYNAHLSTLFITPLLHPYYILFTALLVLHYTLITPILHIGADAITLAIRA
jgi:hypothetical protein